MAWRPDITTILAVWGAVLSTIVFAWDIYKWRTSGPRLRFFASGNMETVNMPAYDGRPSSPHALLMSVIGLLQSPTWHISSTRAHGHVFAGARQSSFLFPIQVLRNQYHMSFGRAQNGLESPSRMRSLKPWQPAAI